MFSDSRNSVIKFKSHIIGSALKNGFTFVSSKDSDFNVVIPVKRQYLSFINSLPKDVSM